MPQHLKATAEIQKTPSGNKSKPQTKKRVFAVISWVLVLLLVGFISFTFSRNKALGANRVSEKALSALKANNGPVIYKLGTKEFQKASELKKVQAFATEWSKVITQATDGKPTLVSKTESVKNKKPLTTLVYTYQVKPGKSKINQKELYSTVVVEKVQDVYKLYTFNIDTN